MNSKVTANPGLHPEAFQEKLLHDGLLSEDNYAADMKNIVEPYLNKRRTDLTLYTSDGAWLFTSRFQTDREKPYGTVMMVHGFTENIEKFREIIHGFLRNGWNVVMYDQRGHGRSYRDEELESNAITHIEHFEMYVSDFGLVYDHYLKNAPGKRVLFSHSMGGAVSALALESRRYDFDRAAFSSPMIAPATNGFPVELGKLLCEAFILMKQGKKRIFTSAPYGTEERFEDSCASSRVRFEWWKEYRDNHPELLNYNPSYCWTLEALRVTDKILAKGEPERITIPVRLYSAELDKTVLIEPQKQFIHHVAKGKFVNVPKARHEIYRSTDDVLYPWWRDMLRFLQTD